MAIFSLHRLEAKSVVEQSLEVGHTPAGGRVPSYSGYYTSQPAVQRLSRYIQVTGLVVIDSVYQSTTLHA